MRWGRRSSRGIDDARVQDETQQRLKLIERVRDGIPIVRACEELGFSRRTYYVSLAAYRRAGIDGVRTTVYRARLRRGVDDFVLRVSRQNPDWGRARVAKALAAYGVPLSPTTVRRVWARHGLIEGGAER